MMKPTSHDFDRFVDWCEEEGLNYETEDFQVWYDDETERLREAYAENTFDWQREQQTEYPDWFE